ncbi:uncharacterized protein K441DRAFT_584419, partial [Cenococcum geophilum 1.58]|uniref:uncharacterized protein n=1 Tax=Cenococcum geophilum 1.58 TaxID=794803 RepID=UPI00358F8E25
DKQRKRWPQLLLIAIDILLILAISNNLERVFLGARCTVLWERVKLRVNIIKILKCLKN